MFSLYLGKFLSAVILYYMPRAESKRPLVVTTLLDSVLHLLLLCCASFDCIICIGSSPVFFHTELAFQIPFQQGSGLISDQNHK